jgi:pimeloyl-ACP methyl ester carboxylesterase
MRERAMRWATRGAAVVLAVGAVTVSVVLVASSDRETSRPKGVPATPAGDQLAWVLAQLNGDASNLRETDVVRRFSAEYLESSEPAPQVVEALRQTARERGPLTFVGFAQPARADMVVALVRTRQGEPAAVRVQVEREGAGRIVNLELGGAPPVVVAEGPFSGAFDVGGRKLFLRCTGEGGPTVVLEGGTTADWFDFQNRLAATTRVCSYDRATAAWSRSDPVATPRTAGDVVADLRAVLSAAGVPGPYVLAGHSNGGFFVQLYAVLHPEEIAGVVLIDAVHVDYHDRRQALLERLGPPPGDGRGGPPPRPAFLDPERKFLLDQSVAQLRSARQGSRFPLVPLVVLSHGRPSPGDYPPGSPQRADEQLWWDLQADLARLVPAARHVVVEASGHDIPAESPDAVLDAIGQVLADLRARR